MAGTFITGDLRIFEIIGSTVLAWMARKLVGPVYEPDPLVDLRPKRMKLFLSDTHGEQRPNIAVKLPAILRHLQAGSFALPSPQVFATWLASPA